MHKERQTVSSAAEERRKIMSGGFLRGVQREGSCVQSASLWPYWICLRVHKSRMSLTLSLALSKVVTGILGFYVALGCPHQLDRMPHKGMGMFALIL